MPYQIIYADAVNDNGIFGTAVIYDAAARAPYVLACSFNPATGECASAKSFHDLGDAMAELHDMNVAVREMARAEV